MRMDNSKYEIKTFALNEEEVVTYSPTRGGIITQIRLHGKEILYLDEETFNDESKNVRGGIPILFPNAGPLPEGIELGEFNNLNQHGFARESKSWTSEKLDLGFKEILVSNDKTKKIYPYDFRLIIEGKFQTNGLFTITQSVENLEVTKKLPLSSGFHPYFKINHELINEIIFEFEEGNFIKENIDKWTNGQYVSVDNPNTPIKIYIPNLGVLVLYFSKEYKKIWIWSLPEKDFICIEPVMNDAGGIIENPQIVKPGENLISEISMNLE